MRKIRRSLSIALLAGVGLVATGCSASFNSPIGIGLRGNSLFLMGGPGSCGSLLSDPAAFLSPSTVHRYYIFDAVKVMESKATASSSEILKRQLPTTAGACGL